MIEHHHTTLCQFLKRMIILSSIEDLTLIVFLHVYMKFMKWATSRENLSSGIFNQVRFKSACSATEASENLETLDIASIHIILSKQRTTKVLIRLRGCAGWSAPLLFAYVIRHSFAWPGPNEPLASIINFIWNDHECKILFIIWLFQEGFYMYCLKSWHYMYFIT